MTAAKQIQNIIEQLMYNQLYAPDYPAEDHTNLKREEERIEIWLDKVIDSNRREDVGNWLKLSRSSIEGSFAKLRSGDRKDGLREIEFAIQYLRNAVTRRSHKANFIGKPEGGVIVLPPSGELRKDGEGT
jgi:hypothetical protein